MNIPKILLTGILLSAVSLLQADEIEENRFSTPEIIRVATVQMHSLHEMGKNVNNMVKKIEECAKQGVRVVLFHECVTSGYFPDEIIKYTEKDLIDAENRIAESCRKNNIFTIYGTPYYKDGIRYNMAIVINNKGETIYRQAKIQLVELDEGWSEPGNWLNTFKIDDKTCSVIICHDSRYPELVRLPVMKGAKLVFYMSWESDIREERKIEPYRAQIVARAVENSVYVIQSNAPQNFSTMEGSHGQSRIVAPDGVLLKEASISGEEILIEDLDLTKSSGDLAEKSLRADFLKDWWEKGMGLIGECSNQ